MELSAVNIVMIIAAALLVGAVAYLIVAKTFSIEPQGIHTIEDPEEAKNKAKARAASTFLIAADRVSNVVPVAPDKATGVKQSLVKAGLNVSASAWRGIQIMFAAAATMLGAAIGMMIGPLAIVLGICIGLSLGLLIPDMALKRMAHNRQLRIERDLPDMLELMSVTVKSGYPIEKAVRTVGYSTEDSPLAAEFRQVDAQIHAGGADLETALELMRERCATPGVDSFTAALIQAKKQGSSVSAVLDSQAKLARSEYYTTMMERVKKLPAKLVLPIFGIMMLVILPLCLAPPLVDMVQNFTNAWQVSGLEDVAGSAKNLLNRR